MSVPVESFVLDPAHGGTLQRQLQDLVIAGVLSGRMRPGARMPSSRALARHLGVSRVTVTLAYADLVSGGWLDARGRSGTFVGHDAPRPIRPTRRPAPAPSGAVDWARALAPRLAEPRSVARPGDWRRYRYPFLYGQVGAELFDHANWRRCALRALGAGDFAAMTEDSYGRDDPLLVDEIVRRILPRRGIAARPEEVLVTMGAQNALWLVAQVLLGQRRTAAMEEPGYPALRDILTQARGAAVSVPVDEDGLPPDAVPEGTDVVFVTPGHHCPTGVAMPAARRRALLALAERRDMLIVEDDYEFELGRAEPPLPALKAMDRAERVVHVGSFAKSLFPGLRLGYVVAAAPLIEALRRMRGLVLRHPPGHAQRATAYFLADGHYDAQVARMSRALRARRQAALDAMEAHGLAPATAGGRGGSWIWMRAPGGQTAAALAARLRRRDVLIEPADAFFEGGAPGPFYRLGYGLVTARDMPEGIGRIAEAGRRLA